MSYILLVHALLHIDIFNVREYIHQCFNLFDFYRRTVDISEIGYSLGLKKCPLQSMYFQGLLRKLIIGTFILFHINIAVQFTFLNEKFLYLNVLNISWPMVSNVYHANSCQIDVLSRTCEYLVRKDIYEQLSLFFIHLLKCLTCLAVINTVD